MSTNGVDRSEVVDLVLQRVRAVLDLPADGVTAESRFDEDLHADSLDLVEVVESVERELSKRGVDISVPDDELLSMHTVGEAAQRIADVASQGTAAS